MDFKIEQLSNDHANMVSDFSCVESKEELAKFNSATRRRIIRHSREMDCFLKNEALEEQEKGLNTTHLFIDKNKNKLIGYLSLCADSVRLDFTEKDELGFSYLTIPAIKIARLAVSNKYKHQGFGKLLIDYSANISAELLGKIGTAFITLDCYEHRVSYYEKYGFVKNTIQPIELEYDSPISMRVLIYDYLEQCDE